MTDEERSLLEQVLAEAQSTRAVLIALLVVHEDRPRLRAALQSQVDATMGTLLAQATPDRFVDLVRQKLHSYLDPTMMG